MTTKDYQLIAEALLEARRGVHGSPVLVAAARLGIDSVESELCRVLRRDNGRFDAARFAAAAREAS